MTDHLFLEHSRRSPRCPVLLAMTELPPAQIRKLIQALDDPGVTGAAIARVLVLWGRDIRADAVNRHRRGDCGCGK